MDKLTPQLDAFHLPGVSYMPLYKNSLTQVKDYKSHKPGYTYLQHDGKYRPF